MQGLSDGFGSLFWQKRNFIKYKKECTALIEIMVLKNQLMNMELQSIYFRGYYDSVGYLRKARIL